MGRHCTHMMLYQALGSWLSSSSSLVLAPNWPPTSLPAHTRSGRAPRRVQPLCTCRSSKGGDVLDRKAAEPSYGPARHREHRTGGANRRAAVAAGRAALPEPKPRDSGASPTSRRDHPLHHNPSLSALRSTHQVPTNALARSDAAGLPRCKSRLFTCPIAHLGALQARTGPRDGGLHIVACPTDTAHGRWTALIYKAVRSSLGPAMADRFCRAGARQRGIMTRQRSASVGAWHTDSANLMNGQRSREWLHVG